MLTTDFLERHGYNVSIRADTIVAGSLPDTWYGYSFVRTRIKPCIDSIATMSESNVNLNRSGQACGLSGKEKHNWLSKKPIRILLWAARIPFIPVGGGSLSSELSILDKPDIRKSSVKVKLPPSPQYLTATSKLSETSWNTVPLVSAVSPTTLFTFPVYVNVYLSTIDATENEPFILPLSVVIPDSLNLSLTIKLCGSAKVKVTVEPLRATLVVAVGNHNVAS